MTFQPTVMDLWNSPMKNTIAGFASINYRLSSYASHSNNPSSPEDPSRNVQYPSHLSDVENALLYLDKEFQISNHYLLIGHSAGATMALELQNPFLPIPAGLLCVSGIYNFESFIKSHSAIPAYQEIMENAFPDKSLWEKASPYTSYLLDLLYEKARMVVISHSEEDELLERMQPLYMLQRLDKGHLPKTNVHYLEASGAHDEIWRSGSILAGLVTKSLGILRDSSKAT